MGHAKCSVDCWWADGDGWGGDVDREPVGALALLWLAVDALMHRDPTFEAAHINLEREKRKQADALRLIPMKQRRIQSLLKNQKKHKGR